MFIMEPTLSSDCSIFSRRSRVELPPLPMWLAALPLAFMGAGRRDSDEILNSALFAASAALAADDSRRDSRARICFLLAELAQQYGRLVEDYSAPIPISRNQLARATGISLTKVKRVTAYLGLVGVIEVLPSGVRISDWQGLCELAAYDRSWLPVILWSEDDATVEAPNVPQEQQEITATVAGDPARFV